LKIHALISRDKYISFSTVLRNKKVLDDESNR
jgi:hypothetical protein